MKMTRATEGTNRRVEDKKRNGYCWGICSMASEGSFHKSVSRESQFLRIKNGTLYNSY